MRFSFNDLGLDTKILDALKEMGFTEPTQVQEEAIPYALNREDIIVRSKTGSGKTAVFGIPLSQMIDGKSNQTQALILTPTRELAVQVDAEIKQISKNLALRSTAIYGQHNISLEIQELKKGVQIVSGTPGRVYDHINQGTLKTKNIKFLVLDEVDRMLDMGFLDQVLRIVKKVPVERNTLLFSATIPEEINKICRSYMKDPVIIEVGSLTKTVETVYQEYYRTTEGKKNEQLFDILKAERPKSCIVFCNTRIAVDKVNRMLIKKGIAAQPLHGDIAQNRRLKTIQGFKEGKFTTLVATDVAGRGIHIDELSLVVNYDVPFDKDSYVHRIGRTGRAGSDGKAITLVSTETIMDLYAIEEHINRMIPEADLPTQESLEKESEKIKNWLEMNHASHKKLNIISDRYIKKSPSNPSRPVNKKSVIKPVIDRYKKPITKKYNEKPVIKVKPEEKANQNIKIIKRHVTVRPKVRADVSEPPTKEVKKTKKKLIDIIFKK